MRWTDASPNANAAVVRGNKGVPTKGNRPLGDCAGCRWACESNNLPGYGRCLLDKGAERCRFHATEAAWERLVAAGSGKQNWGGRRKAETQELELQRMRLGVARYSVAQAAATLDRMPKGSLPEEMVAGIEEMVEAMAVIEDWMYELQGDVVVASRGEVPW